MVETTGEIARRLENIRIGCARECVADRIIVVIAGDKPLLFVRCGSRESTTSYSKVLMYLLWYIIMNDEYICSIVYRQLLAGK